jgi:hypothetical protein
MKFINVQCAPLGPHGWHLDGSWIRSTPEEECLIYVVGRSFCLYADSLFAQIGDSNDKCSSSLEVEYWKEDEKHAAQ